MDWWNELIGQDYFGEQPSFYGTDETPSVEANPEFAGEQDLSGVSLNPLESYKMGGASNYAYDTPSDLSNMNYTPFGDVLSLNSYTMGGGNVAPGVAPTTPSLTNTPSPSGVGMVMGDSDKQNKTLGSSVLDSLGGQKGMALAGILSNLAGNYLNKKATQQGQSNYLKNVTWTPQRTENYMNALRNNVTSLYGNAAQGSNKAMSASNAIRGTGGGAFGRKSEQIGREMRSNIAQAMNQGALTTNAPPNLPQSAFTNTSPVGETITGVGGQIGNAQANKYLLQMLNLLQNKEA